MSDKIIPSPPPRWAGGRLALLIQTALLLACAFFGVKFPNETALSIGLYGTDGTFRAVDCDHRRKNVPTDCTGTFTPSGAARHQPGTVELSSVLRPGEEGRTVAARQGVADTYAGTTAERVIAAIAKLATTLVVTGIGLLSRLRLRYESTGWHSRTVKAGGLAALAGLGALALDGVAAAVF